MLDAAAATLARSGCRSDTCAALLAAALPDGELIGVHAHAVDGELRWRGFTVEATGAAAVGELLYNGAAPADTWTWPTGDAPQRWVRVVRSGTRDVAWGSRAILGGPRVTFDPALTETQRDAVLDHIAANDGDGDPFAVLDTPDGAVLCAGTPTWCHATTDDAAAQSFTWASDTPDRAAVRFAAAELVRRVAAAPVAGVVEGEDPDRFDVHATTADGAHLRVPVQVRADGGTALGATVTGPAPTEAIAPQGWTVAGVAVDGSWVVTRGGICAQLR